MEIEMKTYRLTIEIKDADGVFKEVTKMERLLPSGVGGELLQAMDEACKVIERREGLPGPEGGLSQ